MKTISIMNQKGGSGKTTAAQHLAVVQASNGKRVLFIDTDKQQSGIKFFKKNVDKFPKGYDGVIDFLFAPDDTLKPMLDQHGENYDYIYIDTPPQLSAQMRTVIENSSIVLISCQPKEKDIEAADELVKLIKFLKHDDAYFLISRKKHNSPDDKKREQIKALYSLPILDTHITEYQAYDDADMKGLGVIHLEKENSFKAATEMHKLAVEVEGLF